MYLYNHWRDSFRKTKLGGPVSKRPVYVRCGDAVISLISFTTAAGHGGLLSAVCHLGNHWASLHPSFHICALKIIINIFRAVIEIKEVVVCQLEFHYLGLQQHVPHPCQIPVATYLPCLFLWSPFSLPFSPPHSSFLEWSGGREQKHMIKKWEIERVGFSLQSVQGVVSMGSFQKTQRNFWLY